MIIPIHVPRNFAFDAEADIVGTKRRELAKRQDRINTGGLVGTEEMFEFMDKNSARGERYLKSVLDPIVWHSYREDYVDEPDLGDFVDAKTTNNPLPHDRCRLICQPDRPPKHDWAYVLVVPDQNGDGYWAIGWEWGAALLTKGVRPIMANGRQSYWIWSHELKPIHDLQAILHK